MFIIYLASRYIPRIAGQADKLSFKTLRKLRTAQF